MSIKIEQLTLHIGDTHVCENLDIVFNPKEFWAVLGVNGVGKSTLLHTLIDVDGVTSKNISVDDAPLSSYRHQRKLLAQKTGLLLQEYEYHFPCTVHEATLIGRHPYMSQWQWETHEDRKLAENALRKTSLHHLKDRIINTLSGGEKRRLNIATLLTQDPDYLLLDEPTNHLDLGAQIKILTLLREHISLTNKSGIMVIHDANLANRYCDKVLMLFGDGEWLAGSISELINIENLERLYHCKIQQLSNDSQTVFIPA